MRRRLLRLSGCCLLASAAVLVLTSRPAHSADAVGSGLGSFGANAVSPGMQFTYDYPGASAHPQAEGEAPYALAQLRSGPQAYALSSVAWPGALAANAGTTSQLVNLPVPASAASSLNEPIRAEARTGSGPPTVTNNSYPGVAMTATATGVTSSADTVVAGTSGPVPSSGSGNSEARSTTAVTGTDTVTATAFSLVQDVGLDGGLVKMQAVTSSASGTSSPSGARANGSTTVSGLTIAGQPAYLDQTGLHLGQSGPSAPLNQVAASISQQALTQAGMKVAVSEPTSKISGSTVTYDAGNVVFYFAPPGDSNGDTFTATFGGASITIATSAGFGGALLAPVTTPDTFPTSVATPAAPSAAPVPVGTGTPATASSPTVPPTDRTAPSSTLASGGQPASNPDLASSTPPLSNGIPPAAPVLVILGSGLLALGMRRLPDRVLEQTSTGCTIGENQ